LHQQATTEKLESRAKSASFKSRIRPETAAGGFSRDDGTIHFYTRVNALLKPEMTVLEVGAGRGSGLLGEETFAKRLRRLQGKVRKVIGLDVDSAIEHHPFLDERHVISPTDAYPVADGSVDLVVSDWVIEHVANPEHMAHELMRVLKPNGWFCARTPNRWGYGGMITSLVPNAWHDAILRRVMPERWEEDSFPTAYMLNSFGQLKRHFPAAQWEHFTYTFCPTPKYHGNKGLLFGLIEFYQNVMPNGLKTDLMIFVRKRGEADAGEQK